VTQFAYLSPRASSRLLSLAEVARVAMSLKGGSPAVLPTETGYMLAALATSQEAVKGAFAVKGRSPAAVMHVGCASMEMARSVGILPDRAARLLEHFTPGPLSVIVRKTDLLLADLVTLDGTVGIRVPEHPATLQVINAVGVPLTATSLNASGSQLASVDEAALQDLNWGDREIVYVVRDDDAVVYSSASTLVRVTGEEVEILRPGPISAAQIQRIADNVHEP
jgi:L-threonylcarbamoyladenylate synthase